MSESQESSSLVLFDIDGTLLRNAGVHHKQALIGGIRQVTGIETTLDGIPTVGMLDRDLIRNMLSTAGQSQEVIQLSMSKLLSACQEYYLRNCAADLRDRVCPGVRGFLEVLQSRKVVLGLVTGNLCSIAWKKMELAGLRPFFSVGAFSEHARTRGRLARIALVRAIRAGLVTKQCRVSLVGDHANDIRAAKENKFLSVAVASGLMPYEELKQYQPDILVHDLTELDPSLLT